MYVSTRQYIGIHLSNHTLNRHEYVCSRSRTDLHTWCVLLRAYINTNILDHIKYIYTCIHGNTARYMETYICLHTWHTRKGYAYTAHTHGTWMCAWAEFTQFFTNMYMYVCIYPHLHMYKYACICTDVYNRIYIYVYSYIWVHLCTYLYVCIHSLIHVYVCKQSHVCMYASTHNTKGFLVLPPRSVPCIWKCVHTYI